jgi:hypothetical protein
MGFGKNIGDLVGSIVLVPGQQASLLPVVIDEYFLICVVAASCC